MLIGVQKNTQYNASHLDIWVAKINKRNWICFCSDFLILGVKGIQWLNNYFCVQFTWIILGIVIFVQTSFDLNGSIHKNYNFHVKGALLRQVQGHLNCLLRPHPSPNIDQNVKNTRPYPHV